MRWRRDVGETLVELLMTVAILGIAGAGLVAGVGTAVQASDVQRKSATAEAVLRSYGEGLKDPASAYVPCARPADYALPGYSPPPGYRVSVTAVGFWNGRTPAGFGNPPATCPAADAGLQRLTVEVRSADDRAVERVDILKRRP